MLTQDARVQRRLAHRKRVRRRRIAVFVLLAVALTAGLFFGLRGGGDKAASAPPASSAETRINEPASSRVAITHRPSTTRLALPATLPNRTLEVPILMYHRIDVLRPSLPAITRSLTVAPADFAAQMRWLKVHGFHAITQEQLFAALERGKALPAGPILITFDDGYRDVLKNAAPVLHRLDMPATAYVITGRISGPDVSFFSWAQLHTLEQEGVEVGSHTVHHVELPGLTDPAALQELIQSRLALERHLHHPVQWFAYPAGRFDARTERLVGQAGYVLAVTTQPGSAQSASAPFALHRYEVLDTTGVRGLAALLGR
jgi:peptidoglycan/xylan/chitin deacetylase (PgdA/CDA1 family)